MITALCARNPGDIKPTMRDHGPRDTLLVKQGESSVTLLFDSEADLRRFVRELVEVVGPETPQALFGPEPVVDAALFGEVWDRR